MRSFVISLERAAGRRARFLAHAARRGWAVEVFPAIDWRDLVIGETAEGYEVTHREGKGVCLRGVAPAGGAPRLRAGEYACALSHMALWRKLLDEGDERLAVFEDDAVIRGRLVDRLPADADFVFLGEGVSFLEPAGLKRTGRAWIDWCAANPYAPLVPGCGTFAYIVTRQGAEKGLRAMQPMRQPIDLQLMASGHGTAAAGHPLHLARPAGSPDCRIYAATVPLARHEDEGVSYVKEAERPPLASPGTALAGSGESGRKRVVIGLGTGRCGTQTFAALMAQQEGVAAAGHERVHLPWLGGDDAVWQRRAEALLGPEDGGARGGIHCEVGLWYLPYVPHLMAAAARRETDLKFVVLERPDDAVVASFLRKVGPLRNHWQPHDGPFDPYDACFPQFPPDTTREEAIRRYCRAYKARCRELAQGCGEVFRFFETNWFASADQTASLLAWCGIERPRVDAIPKVDASAAPLREVEATEARHRELRRAFLEAVPPLPAFTVPRGIVICGGGEKYLPSAWVLVNELRVLGCELPMQLWHLGAAELPAEWAERMAAAGVACVDALEVRRAHPARILRGWEVKPYAMLHCPFREVLLLDADNHPVRDPSFLFSAGPYLETGSLFWPDLGRLGPDRAIWRLCDVDWRDEPEFESGQMVVNKERCWRELQLTMHLNAHSDFYYQHIHGDKDTFHMAWRMLGTPYGMIPHPVARMRGGLVQADLEGQRLFQHRAGGTKWKPRGNAPIPGYVHWDRCVRHLEALELPAALAPATAPFHENAMLVRERLARYAALLAGRCPTMREALLRLAGSPGRCVVELGITQSFVPGGRPGCLSPDPVFWKPQQPASWDWGAGFFTRVVLECLQGLPFTYHGIDPNPDAHAIARTVTAGLDGDIRFHATTAEQFLATWDGTADLLYFDHGASSEETARMHARDALTVLQRGMVRPGGMVLMDDHQPAGAVPKTKYALPLFLEAGWQVIRHGAQVLLVAPGRSL